MALESVTLVFAHYDDNNPVVIAVYPGDSSSGKRHAESDKKRLSYVTTSVYKTFEDYKREKALEKLSLEEMQLLGLVPMPEEDK